MLYDTGEDWNIISADGGTAITFHSFVNIDVTNETGVTQAPVEQGGFVDYNKVLSPTNVGLMLSIKGDSATLQQVIDQINDLTNGTDLVNIVTPYAEFKNYAIEKYQYSQDASTGLDVLYFNFSFVEVRQVATQYSNARVSSNQKRGQQQTQETSILSAIFSG